MSGPDFTRSTASVLSDTLSNVSSLVRNEVDLARTELNENVTRAAVAIGLIAGAGLIVLVALNVLTGALIAGLTEAGLDAGWAALIVGVIFCAIAWGMLSKGINDLKLSSLAPTRTARNVKRDASAVKEAYNAK